MLDAAGERSLQSLTIRHERPDLPTLDLGRRQFLEQPLGIGHLRHAVGSNESADLDRLDPGREELPNKRELCRQRNLRGLTLQSVSRPHFHDPNRARHGHPIH
jgi:hypothetical protein